MAMASRVEKTSGSLTNQSPLTRAFCAKPPWWVWLSPQPLATTRSPAWKPGCDEAVTVPAKSMPGISGKRWITGARPLIASASL
jgi:hypothetical protein